MRYYRKEGFHIGEEVSFDEENNQYTAGKQSKLS